MTPEFKNAREAVIAAMAEELAHSYTGYSREHQHLITFLRRGYVGFDNMTVAELEQTAAAAGMSERLAAHFDVLQAQVAEAEGPDFTVTIEISVTADSANQAVEHAMDDLGDPALRWNARVKDCNGGLTVEVDTADALAL